LTLINEIKRNDYIGVSKNVAKQKILARHEFYENGHKSDVF